MTGHPQQNGRGGPAIRGVVHGHVVVAVDLLRSRLTEPWTLDTLASEVHLSRSQLVRAFDTVVGMSPMAYLRKMRVEQLAVLLASTDLPIGVAARAVGWDNSSYVSRCFRARYGCSPGEYRRSHAGAVGDLGGRLRPRRPPQVDRDGLRSSGLLSCLKRRS